MVYTYAGAEQVDGELPEWELDALIGLMEHRVHGMTNLQSAMNTAVSTEASAPALASALAAVEGK